MLAPEVQTFVQRSPRYLGFMCEIMRHDAGKWAAIRHLAELWGVAPDEICAVGDDVNDIPMLALPASAWPWATRHPEVQNAARWITGNHDQDGVAMVVDEILGHTRPRLISA